MIAVARPILRAYQETLIERVRDRIRTGLRRIVMVAVVGAGKTVMASAMIESAVTRGGRVLFLAHRTELIDQACAKLASFGVAYGVILSGRPGNPLAQVQVASVQTLGRRLKRQDPAGLQIVARAWDHFDLIIADEAHHFCAGTFREVLDAYPDATVIGLTATPYRLDGAGLADVFQAIEAGPQIAELVELGFLVRPVVYAPPPPVGLANLHLRAGEYRSDEANKVLNQTAPIHEIVETWRLRAAGRTTVGFGCTVEHAQHLAAAFLGCRHSRGRGRRGDAGGRACGRPRPARPPRAARSLQLHDPDRGVGSAGVQRGHPGPADDQPQLVQADDRAWAAQRSGQVGLHHPRPRRQCSPLRHAG
jgi:DNA repair protein RadD